MMNDFLLIIDGSSLLSTQYYGNLPREVLFAKTEEEKAKYYHKIMQSSKGVYTNGVFGFFKTLLAILRMQKPRYLAVCWDRTRDTFRRDIYKEYKGNRKETPDPLSKQFALCQEALERIGVAQFSSDDFEADDYAGSLSAKFESKLPISIMTKDRDYLQLVDENVAVWMVSGSAQKAQELYKKHGVKSSDYIAPDSVFYLTPDLVKKEYGFPPEKTVFFKALAGDSADNIPGVKGIGEKTAVILANAYANVDALYDEIRDLDAKGLEEVKNRWKQELGLKRSPMKYLLASSSEEEVLGEAGAKMSEALATIKRDIDLSEISLDSLTTKLDAQQLALVFHELEFQSLSIDYLEEVLDGQQGGTEKDAFQINQIELTQLQEMKKSLSTASRVAITVLFDKKIQKKEEPKQLNLFDFMSTDAVQKTDSDLVNTNHEKAQEDEFGYFIYGVALAAEEDSCYLLTKAQFEQEDLKSLVRFVYEEVSEVISFDMKEQLNLLPAEVRNALLLDTNKTVAYDITVADYLLNPLKQQYIPSDMLLEFGVKIPNRVEICGKETLADASEEKMKLLYDCIAKESAKGLLCFAKYEGELKSKQMWDLFCNIEMPTLFTLYEMEYNGVLVKREALRVYGDQLQRGIDDLEQKIYAQAGHEFNINSPKQLGVVLFEELGLPAVKKTKSGYSTSADVLETLKEQAPIVADILSYRQLTKLHSTYALGLDQFIQKDGRIHGHFNQTVTATGRISSTEPNLQNIPMRTELGRQIRKVFVPEEGSVFVDADYSQIELRILAHLSKDKTLIDAFENDVDIHALTASQVFHVPFDEVTSLQRRNAKAVNFGIVYGISAHGLAVDLGISRKEASEYMDQYFASYPSIKEYLDGLVDEGHMNGAVATMFHRIRPIPEMHSSNYNQRQFGQRVAMNSPIQGTAADIMKIAMVNVQKGIVEKKLKSRLVLQIHDELVVETKKEELEIVKELVQSSMSKAADLDVPLAVDLNIGDDWYESK